MLEDALFWLGIVGLVSGIMVGISLLEDEGDPFVRNIMFSAGIACVLFVYLFQVAEKSSWSPLLFLASFFIGGVAALLPAWAAHGNQRAAFIGGGLAGVTLQVMARIFPYGSIGPHGIEDFAVAIDISATLLVGGGVYYLLRHWGKVEKGWD